MNKPARMTWSDGDQTNKELRINVHYGAINFHSMDDTSNKAKGIEKTRISNGK